MSSRSRSGSPLCARVAVVAASLVSVTQLGCASSPDQRPRVGQRVSVPARQQVSGPDSRTLGRRAVGALVRQSGDTVWLDDGAWAEERVFVLSSGRQPTPTLAGSVDDAWLVGDSLLRIVESSAERSFWEVQRVARDTLLLAASVARGTNARRPGPVPDVRWHRQVRRIRPVSYLVYGGVLLAGGLFLASRREPEEVPCCVPVIDGGDVATMALLSMAIASGAGTIFMAFLPRPGWDRIDGEDLPPIRMGVDRGRLDVGFALPVGLSEPPWRKPE